MDLSNCSVKNLKYNFAGHIDLEIKHPEYGWIPFTASAEDCEPHGKEIFEKAIAGGYGEVAPFVKPKPIKGEDALNRVRAKRNMLLEVNVDPLVMNPLRWSDLSQAQKDSILAYRLALLNITESHPNVEYVFNVETGDFEESKITWPQFPAL